MTHESILLGFQDLHRAWISRAQMIVQEHSSHYRYARLGLEKLDQLGHEIADKLEEISLGKWPLECQSILAKTLHELTKLAYQLKEKTKRPLIEVLDLQTLPVLPTSGILN